MAKIQVIGLCLLATSGMVQPAIVAQPAPLPYRVAQIPGWKALQGRGVELWLPANFQGGSPTDNQARSLIDGIKALGPGFAQIASLIEQNPAVFALVAVDPQSNRSGGVTNVLVSVERVLPTLTLESYMDTLARALPEEIKIVDRKLTRLGIDPAGRVVTEATVQGQGIRQLLYIIKQRDVLWTVGYSTRAAEYDQRLPVFERSIQTFKTQPGAVQSPTIR